MAIPISELRIGNMFWEDYGGYKIVTAIGFNNVGEFPNHVQGRAIGYKVSGLFDADKIDPIPLSPEVLMACGFKKFDSLDESLKMLSWYQHDWMVGYCSMGPDAPYGGFSIDNLSFGQKPKKEVAYLHQLQNLYFALSGKELTYNKP